VQEEDRVRKDAKLVKKRNELKQEITSGMYTLLMGLIFEYTSRLIQKLTRSAIPPPFYYTVIIVAFVIQLVQVPGLLVAILLKETHQYSELFVVGSLAIELAFAGIVVAKININYVLQNLRDHAVDAIESIDNLSDLHYWLSYFWAVRKQLSFAVAFGIIAGALTAVGFSRTTKEFIGLGVTITSILAWTIAVIPVYYMLLMAILPFRLSRYQYDLFDANPSRSEVLRRLSLTLKNYTYVVAIFIAFTTFFYGVNSSTRSLNIIVLIIGWIPLSVQSFSNRFALRTIARNAKWKTLKEIELKIKKIQEKANLADKATMECITRLMDYHDRISAMYDSALDLRARLSFLNQIFLTLLAYALSNIDSIINIFR
jgi:hypothetical protein